MNLSKETAALETLFDKFNDAKFGGELVKPMIVIQSNGRKHRFLGWCSIQKIWKESQEADGYYEITICAEFLKRTLKEIATTMLHEMVHLYNLAHGIKDVSNGTVYHNKHFKKEAEARGLVITKAPTIGWSLSQLNPETEMLVESFGIDEGVFAVARATILTTSKKAPKQFTYTCEICNEKVRSTNPELMAYCQGEEGQGHDKELFVKK